MYKSMSGPKVCKLCPFCGTTLEPGATSKKMCVADIGCEGKGFGWGIGFTKCKTGSFKISKGNGDCPPCPKGENVTGGGHTWTPAGGHTWTPGADPAVAKQCGGVYGDLDVGQHRGLT
jgi:hypothetical protein